MAKHTLQVFERVVLDIDGEEYLACEFRDCLLRFGGGAMPVMQECNIVGGNWQFVGAASRTVSVLKALLHQEGDGSIRKSLLVDLGLSP